MQNLSKQVNGGSLLHRTWCALRQRIGIGARAAIAARVALALGAVLLIGVSAGRAAELVEYYHGDALGSPVSASDSTGAVLYRERYAPYGARERQEADGNNNSRWYTGHPEDKTTGLVYAGARWYDPAIGRFLGTDPQGVSFTNLQSFNRYAYANNNPYRYVDPDGNSPIDVVFFAYDVGKAAAAIYTGQGVGAALVDAAISGAALFSPVPGAGEAFKAARIVESGVQANRMAGKAFERQVVEQLGQSQTGVVREVTVRTQSGVRTRLDALGRDSGGVIRCTECKSSATAPLTKKQSAAFPEIETTGATVVGKGKPGFPGGTIIPPTRVDIIRP